MAKINKRLLITAVVRDNAATARRCILKLSRLSKEFAALAFVVYENNSTDGTKEILRELSREIPSLSLVSEDLGEEAIASIATARHRNGKPCRIELIARARERARELALRDFGDYDLVLNIDVDAAWFSLSGIRRNAARIARGELDCVCANGITKWLRYRDAFAFRSAAHPYGPELLGEYWWEVTVGRIQQRLRGKRLVPAYSAFGGAALLSMAAFREGKYSAIPDGGYMEVQAGLDSSLAPEDERLRASGFPIPNSNYSKPIVCEHVPFFYALRSRGFDRLFIDPAWRILFLD